MPKTLTRTSLRHLTAALTLTAATAAAAQEQAPPAQPDRPATAPASPVGEYVMSQMELIAGILLKEDGSFQYGLTVGSLDERAQGRWTAIGNRITFTSAPRPVAPAISAGPVDKAPDSERFALSLKTAGGQDARGIDMTIEFESGDPLEAYTQGGMWTLPAEEMRTPRFVTFSKPSYRLQSERFALDPRTGMLHRFILAPNDFGVADFTGLVATVDGDTLALDRPQGQMRFQKRRP